MQEVIHAGHLYKIKDKGRVQIVLGAIVRFGPRVGIVVGEIEHHLRGDCWLVRTPTTVIKDQMGDLVPKDSGVSLATHAELIEHCQQVIADASETLMDWTKSTLHQVGSNPPLNLNKPTASPRKPTSKHH